MLTDSNSPGLTGTVALAALASESASGAPTSAPNRDSVDGRVKEIIVDSRINKILSMRTDSTAMLEALDAISEFYVINTVEARRSLRQDLEFQNIALGKRFLAEFNKVLTKIDTAEALSTKLVQSCASIASKVSEADQNMKSFMEKASELEHRRNSILDQGAEIQQFLNRFQLSPEEVETLHYGSIDKSIGAVSFFDALERLCVAYNDCKIMVEKHCYTAGFELLDILGQHQDMAYRRLYEWVRSKCDALAESGSVEDIDAILQVAVRYLRRLPVYYSQCQDLIVNSRRTQLVQRFILALTQGGPSGQLYRAIDLHANDAVRYVGDMLSWMHQAVASEEEFLKSIFVVQSHEASMIPTTDGSSSPQGFSIDEMLSRCIQGLGRPLRVRIMQTLEIRPQLETFYALFDLLSFYEAVFRKLSAHENAVHSAVNGCLLECKRLLKSAVHKQGEALIHSPSSCPLDLTSSHATKECSKQLRDVLKVHSTAMSALPVDGPDDCSLDSLVGSIIQPLLQSCRLSCQSTTQADMSVFMLNNVSTLEHELKGLDAEDRSAKGSSRVIDSWMSILNAETTTWVDVLVGEESLRMLRRSDMDQLLELIQLLPEGLTGSEQPGLSQDRVGTVLRAFYASLFSTVAPQFDRLTDPDLRETARKRISEAVAAAHEKVHRAVSQPSNGYDTSILHSIEDVKVILGCK